MTEKYLEGIMLVAQKKQRLKRPDKDPQNLIIHRCGFLTAEGLESEHGCCCSSAGQTSTSSSLVLHINTNVSQ